MYIPAKILGCQVEKFQVWSDKWFCLLKFKIKETEFVLGWLPTYAYIKVAGMIYDPDEELQPYHFRALTPIKRIIIIISSPLIALSLGVWLYSLYLPKLPAGLFIYSLLFLGTLFCLVLIHGQISKKLITRNKDKSMEGFKRLPFLLAMIFLGLILLVSYYYVDAFTPFFYEVRAFFSGEIDLYISDLTADNSHMLAGFIGAWLYVWNMMPFAGLNGYTVVEILYEVSSGKPIPDKIMLTFRIIAIVINLFVFCYLFYLVKF